MKVKWFKKFLNRDADEYKVVWNQTGIEDAYDAFEYTWNYVDSVFKWR